MQAVCLECDTRIAPATKFCTACGASLETVHVVDGAETVREKTATDRQRGTNWGCIILAIVVGLMGAVWVFAQAGGIDRVKAYAGAAYVTLDGERAIQNIKLWNGYGDQAIFIVGSGKPDQRVKVIERLDDAALVELPNGTRGWVSYLFIKEYQ